MNWKQLTVPLALTISACQPTQAVNSAPTLTQDLQNATAVVGGTVTFTVVATGSNLSYQWFKNNTRIQDANGSNYTTPALQTADNNTRFKVTVSNPFGETTSREVTLTVNPANTSTFNQNEGGKGGFLLGSYANGGQPTSTNWTRQSKYAGPTRAHIKWTYKLGDSTSVELSEHAPIVGPDGTVYITVIKSVGGQNKPELHAIDSDGRQKWKKELLPGEGELEGLVLSSDNTLYGRTGPKVMALDALTGNPKWLSSVLGYWSMLLPASITMDAQNNVYIGTTDNNPTNLGRLSTLKKDGKQGWSSTMQDSPIGSPIIGSDGTLYTNSESSRLYAFHPDGRTKWTFTVDPTEDEFAQNMRVTPLIDENGTIYTGTMGGALYAVNPNGTKKWKVQLNGDVWGSFAIGQDGTLYVHARTAGIYALNRDTGQQKWFFELGQHKLSSPLVDRNGRVYINSTEQGIHAIDPDGNEKWHYLDPIESHRMTMEDGAGMALGPDGTLYTTAWITENNVSTEYLYAFSD